MNVNVNVNKKAQLGMRRSRVSFLADLLARKPKLRTYETEATGGDRRVGF